MNILLTSATSELGGRVASELAERHRLRLTDRIMATVEGEFVVGPQEQIETVSIGPDDDLDVRRADMLSALDTVDAGEGVVVLTDMFGGSPSNLAISAMEHSNVEVIAGVNLPMLVKLASVRGECGLDEAITQAQEAGRKYISVASQILAAN